MTTGPQADARAPQIILVALLVASLPAPYAGYRVLLGATVALALICYFFTAQERKPLRYPIAVAALLLWCLTSVAWSSNWRLAINGSAQLLALSVVGVTLAALLSPRQALRCFSIAFRLTLIATLAMAILDPAAALTQDAYESGALQGYFNHRNALGSVTALAFVTALARRREVSAATFVLDVSLAAGCLLATRSQTSLIVSLAALALFAAIRFLRSVEESRRAWVGGLLLTCLGLATWYALTNLSTITGSFGRDSTLTGRTVIWDAILRAVHDSQPVLGLGWNSVWHAATEETQALWAAIGFPVYHAHNGYLDILIQIGWIGLALLSVAFLQLVTTSARFAVSGTSAWTSWAFVMTTVWLMINITESRIADPFGFLLLCLLLAQMSTGERTSPGRVSADAEGAMVQASGTGASWARRPLPPSR